MNKSLPSQPRAFLTWLLCALLLSFAAPPRARAEEKRFKNYRFNNYADLLAHHEEGVDFQIVVARRPSPVLIAAIHGGNVEPGTSEIADLVAGDEHSLYKFESLLPEQAAWDHHLNSTAFDEPRANAMIAACSTCVTIHGFWGRHKNEPDRPIVLLGGLNLDLREKIQLRLLDFAERFYPGLAIQIGQGRFAGVHPNNVVNRPPQAGAQLELSRLFCDDLRNRPALMARFADHVRLALDAYARSGSCKTILK